MIYFCVGLGFAVCLVIFLYAMFWIISLYCEENDLKDWSPRRFIVSHLAFPELIALAAAKNILSEARDRLCNTRNEDGYDFSSLAQSCDGIVEMIEDL